MPANLSRHAAFLSALEAPEAQPWPGEHDTRAMFFEELHAHPDSVSREYGPRHFTASAMVVDRSGEWVALHLHRKAQRWLQFGGHIDEDDVTFEAAARREVAEESGLFDLELVGVPGWNKAPLRLHTHGLGARFGSCREHWDVQYLLRTSFTPAHLTDGLAISAESDSLRWFRLTDLPHDVAEDLAPALSVLVPKRLATT